MTRLHIPPLNGSFRFPMEQHYERHSGCRMVALISCQISATMILLVLVSIPENRDRTTRGDNQWTMDDGRK